MNTSSHSQRYGSRLIPYLPFHILPYETFNILSADYFLCCRIATGAQAQHGDVEDGAGEVLHRAGVGEGFLAVFAEVADVSADGLLGFFGHCEAVFAEALQEYLVEFVCSVIVEDEGVVVIIDTVACEGVGE